MASAERSGSFRRIESTAEKVGGGIITVLGALSLNLPEVALGLAIFFIGRWRTPKNKQ